MNDLSGAARSVIIVGASAAGLTTAESLRRTGFAGSVLLIGDEDRLPYDRPPLSKQILAGDWPIDRAQFRRREQLDARGIELITSDAAVSLDTDRRRVTLASGRRLQADRVVIATGVGPRTLPGREPPVNVHSIRRMDDAIRLRDQLQTPRRMVVIGDGVLGAEIAATARTAGHDVTVVGPQAALMQRQLGPVTASILTDLHAERGVRLELGRLVDDLTVVDGWAQEVCLTDGTRLPADLVVVALGSVPVTDWLGSSGLELSDGVACDSRCRAAEDVYAVGDVSRWWHRRLGRTIRLENRTNATEQAITVAANIQGADRAYEPVPYFWTEQYDATLQLHGVMPETAEISTLDGALPDRRFVAAARSDGLAAAVIGWNMAKQARLHRRQLLDPAASAI